MLSFMAYRHRGFVTAGFAGIVVGIVLLVLAPQYATAAAINAFFFVYVAMVVPAAARKLTPAFLRKHADEEDAPALVIFFVMVIAALVSAISLIVVMAEGRAGAGWPLALGAASVVLGWFAVHTMMAMHYAYEFYGRPDAGVTAAGKDGAAGGLAFAGTDEPDGTAFLYFAYTVGMTAQTSDTSVSTNAMRRIVWLHSIFSFFFNTIIVASAVNIVVTLGS